MVYGQKRCDKERQKSRRKSEFSSSSLYPSSQESEGERSGGTEKTEKEGPHTTEDVGVVRQQLNMIETGERLSFQWHLPWRRQRTISQSPGLRRLKPKTAP